MDLVKGYNERERMRNRQTEKVESRKKMRKCWRVRKRERERKRERGRAELEETYVNYMLCRLKALSGFSRPDNFHSPTQDARPLHYTSETLFTTYLNNFE